MCHAPCLQALPAPASQDALTQPLWPELHDVRHCPSCRSRRSALYPYNVNGAYSESLNGMVFSMEITRSKSVHHPLLLLEQQMSTPSYIIRSACVLTDILGTCWLQTLRKNLKMESKYAPPYATATLRKVLLRIPRLLISKSRDLLQGYSLAGILRLLRQPHVV